MSPPFSHFVIFAGMRTGSNFLEANLREFPGLDCHGELFNPHFIGQAKKREMFGVDLKTRESDPLALLGAMKKGSAGLPGFRFFHDHDPRVLKHCLGDRKCGKIILTRNPLDSYLSREIARQTNQWLLGDGKQAKSARISFNIKNFDAHVAQVQDFQLTLRRGLQTSGQAGFYLGYEDVADVEVLNGLVRFLGVGGKLHKPSVKTKKQNPQKYEEKVTNFREMEQALAKSDYFSLHHIPNFEPRRGPLVNGYVAPPRAPVLYMPIAGGPGQVVENWLAALDDVGTDELLRDFTQKRLRQWKRQSKGHRTFTVVRHPVKRLHRAFVRHILSTGPGAYHAIREVLRREYRLDLPENQPDPDYSSDRHRAAFIGFAEFVKANLAGQTSIRVDGAWASQSAMVNGMAGFLLPDHVFREPSLLPELECLARQMGLSAPALAAPEPDRMLEAIYDEKLESAVRAAYQRDYMMFGFGPWRG